MTSKLRTLAAASCLALVAALGPAPALASTAPAPSASLSIAPTPSIGVVQPMVVQNFFCKYVDDRFCL